MALEGSLADEELGALLVLATVCRSPVAISEYPLYY
jgi:hypothetical protein